MKFKKIRQPVQNIQKSIQTLCYGLAITLLVVTTSSAQMFSVGNEENHRRSVPQTEIYAGWEPVTSTYEGTPEQLDLFSFDGPIIRLGYKMSNLEIYFGTGGKITGIDDISYLDIGGNLDLGLPVYSTKYFTMNIPVRISSRLTNITNSSVLQINISRFRFGSLAVGAGAQALARVTKNIRLQASAVPGYGFAFASGGFFGGSISLATATGRLYFDKLFNQLGLSLGYRYNQRRYDIDENQYDYFIKSHSVQIGINF